MKKHEKGERPGRPNKKYVGLDLDARVFDEIDHLASDDRRTFASMLRIIIDLGLATHRNAYRSHGEIVENLFPNRGEVKSDESPQEDGTKRKYLRHEGRLPDATEIEQESDKEKVDKE